MMSHRSRLSIIGLGVCLFVAAIVVVYLAQFRGMQPIDGNGVESVGPYASEFGEMLANAHREGGYSEPTDAPDGRHTARMEELLSGNPLVLLVTGNSWRRIIVTSNYGSHERRNILAIEEADPGSGLSYYYRWSRDSKALFIFGCGRPNGESSSRDLAFIYVIADEMLYEVDAVNQPCGW